MFLKSNRSELKTIKEEQRQIKPFGKKQDKLINLQREPNWGNLLRLLSGHQAKKKKGNKIKEQIKVTV